MKCHVLYWACSNVAQASGIDEVPPHHYHYQSHAKDWSLQVALVVEASLNRVPIIIYHVINYIM